MGEPQAIKAITVEPVFQMVQPIKVIQINTQKNTNTKENEARVFVNLFILKYSF
jgi:hypothetical protein